jgi:hypothetical protein
MDKRRYSLFIESIRDCMQKEIEKVPTRSLVDSVDVLKRIHQLYPNGNEHQIDQSVLFHHHATGFYKRRK